jgi:hypothetical protein
VLVAVVGVVLRGAGVVAVLVILGGVVTGVWLCIWVAAGYGVTTPVVVLEALSSAFDAFGRSWDLTRGFRGKVVGLSVVAFVLFNFLPALVLSIIAEVVKGSSAPAGMVFEVLSNVVPVILYPAISCVFTLMYYDLRVRREGFDLQMLSDQLGNA